MNAPTFTPTAEWQDVPEGAVLPPGCQVHLDVNGTTRRARWLDLSAEAFNEAAGFDPYADEMAAGMAGGGHVVTILEEIAGKPVNKEVKRNADGSITKGMKKSSQVYRAQTLAAPDLATFADIIADLSDNAHKTLMLGEFKGAPDGVFLVLPEHLVAKHLGLDDQPEGERREAVLGFHEHPHHKLPMVARLKDNAEFGGWLLFDRDTVEGMPEELATLNRDDWLDAMTALLPGFKACRRLTLPSTSSRIEVDSKKLDSSSYHVFVQVSDPHDIPRVWGQLLPKALVTPAPLPSWEEETMLGFLRPKFDRDDRSKVVAYQPWSIFDPSTGQTNRLVFDGAPTVSGPGLRVLPAEFELHDGPLLDLSAFADLEQDQLGKVENDTGLKVKLERRTNGAGVRVVGVSTTSPTLSLDLKVETKKGWTTIGELQTQEAPKTRCQSPFRESSSWAAYYHTHEDGTPFLFDSGTATKYVLPEEQTGDAIYDLSHDGLALHMGKRWVKWARHVNLWGRWLFWSGSEWVIDEKRRHLTLTRDYLRKRADDMVRDAKAGKLDFGGKEPDKAVEIAEAQAKVLRMAPTIASVVDLARSNVDLAASVEQWDKDPMLLGGDRTIDLRTGQSRYPKPEDYMIKRAGCAPSFEPPTLWLSCLDTWTAGDKELQAYLQRMCGYLLTGSIEEEVFFFFYGLGKNGKTKFIEAVKGIMGDYAGTMGSEVLMQSQTERHPTEIARLRGLRLAVASEVEKGRTWAENRIKSLTGGDTLQARFMRQDIFEFKPTFKLVVIGNNKPTLRAVDEAIRRRMHLIPFVVTIPEADRDPRLDAKLKEEWPQILGWMVEGCKEWQRVGLNPPAAVRAATEEYLENEDTFEQWRGACTTVAPEKWETSSALFASWKAWAERANEHAGSQKAFSQQLQVHGCRPDKQFGERGYFGLKLRDLAQEAHEAMQKQGLA